MAVDFEVFGFADEGDGSAYVHLATDVDEEEGANGGGGAEKVFVALNFSDQLTTLTLPQLGRGHISHSTHMDRDEDVNLASLQIRPNEGVIVHIKK